MTEIVIAGSIILVALIIGVIIIVSLRKKYSISKDILNKQQPKEYNLEIKKPYLRFEELKFLETLNKVLPAECVAFPKVGVDAMVNPALNKQPIVSSTFDSFESFLENNPNSYLLNKVKEKDINLAN